MFERFTSEARETVVNAQDVARETGTGQIDTRHELVALLEAPGSTAAAVRSAGADPALVAASARESLLAAGLDGEALASVGIDLDAVRRETDAVFGTGSLDRAGRTRGGHLPFTPEAKKSLELALREALRLKQRSIRGEHLLLGMIRAESAARTILVQCGVDLERLRTALEEPRAA